MATILDPSAIVAYKVGAVILYALLGSLLYGVVLPEARAFADITYSNAVEAYNRNIQA